MTYNNDDTLRVYDLATVLSRTTSVFLERWNEKIELGDYIRQGDYDIPNEVIVAHIFKHHPQLRYITDDMIEDNDWKTKLLALKAQYGNRFVIPPLPNDWTERYLEDGTITPDMLDEYYTGLYQKTDSELAAGKHTNEVTLYMITVTDRRLPISTHEEGLVYIEEKSNRADATNCVAHSVVANTSFVYPIANLKKLNAKERAYITRKIRALWLNSSAALGMLAMTSED